MNPNQIAAIAEEQFKEIVPVVHYSANLDDVKMSLESILTKHLADESQHPTPDKSLDASQLAFDAYYEISALPMIHTDAVSNIIERAILTYTASLRRNHAAELQEWGERNAQLRKELDAAFIGSNLSA